MTPLFPRPIESPLGGSAPHGLVDPRLDRQGHRARWAAQAARWRATELALLFFGSEARVRMEGSPGRPGLQGILHLEVPFAGLDDHRTREAGFLSSVGVDELLRAVPLLFVFGVTSLHVSPEEVLPPFPDPAVTTSGRES